MSGWSLAALLVMVLCRSSAVGVSVPFFGCRSPPDGHRPWPLPAVRPRSLCPPAPFPECDVLPGDDDAPFPDCCPEVDRCHGRCLAADSKRWFKVGDRWTLPGCRQAVCTNTDSVSILPCGLIGIRPGCRAAQPNPDAEYPACCYQEVCDEPPPEEQCYDEQLDRHFSVGEKWDRPGCGGQATCRPGGAVSTVGCPPQEINKRSCRLDDGDASLEYPQCCPKITCGLCHSQRHDRYFELGDTWTDDTCDLVECRAWSRGTWPALVMSCGGVLKVSPDCEMTVTDLARGDFPECCPRMRCPGRCQDHGQWYRVGEQWEDADGCSRVTCVDTDRVERLTCSPPAEDDLFRRGCRLVYDASDAPFPACCGKVTCYPGPPVALECRDAAGASRKVGDTWTEAGCVRSSCEVAEGGVAVVRRGDGCRPPPFAKCVMETGNSDLDHLQFPVCCPTYRCPGHCFSHFKDRWFSVDERWTEDCQEALCTEGGLVVTKNCPPVAPTGPGCRVVKGHPDDDYPNCCDAVVCEQNPCR